MPTALLPTPTMQRSIYEASVKWTMPEDAPVVTSTPALYNAVVEEVLDGIEAGWIRSHVRWSAQHRALNMALFRLFHGRAGEFSVEPSEVRALTITGRRSGFSTRLSRSRATCWEEEFGYQSITVEASMETQWGPESFLIFIGPRGGMTAYWWDRAEKTRKVTGMNALDAARRRL